MSLKWVKKADFHFGSKIKDISFSAGGEYLLVAGEHHLVLHKIRYQYTGTHEYDIPDLEEFFKVDIDETIKKCCFSPDSKYFATLGDNPHMVYIWDFATFSKPRHELDVDYSEERNIVNYALAHPNEVVEFNFRENFHEKIVNKF